MFEKVGFRNLGVHLQALLLAHSARICAAAVIAVTYFLAQPISVSSDEFNALAERFSFEIQTIPNQSRNKTITRHEVGVHRDVRHLIGMVTSAGAGVAVGDLDGDGRANDLCLTDPRTHSATVMPAPGSGERYTVKELVAPPRAIDQPVNYPSGCLIIDINEDGANDTVVYYGTRPPVAFLRHEDNFIAQDLLPGSNEIWTTSAGLVADFDGDGHLDLVFGTYYPDGARMYDPTDLSPVRLNASLGNATNSGHTHFFLFEKTTSEVPPRVQMRRVFDALPEHISRGWTLAIGARDLNGDLKPELYLANDYGPDRLLVNQSRPGQLSFKAALGARSFAMPKSKSLGHDTYKGMGVDFGNLDEDGLPDIVVSNVTSDFAFEESNFAFRNSGQIGRLSEGHAAFVDESESLGISRSGFSWDIRFGDFDNDGTDELVQATGFIAGTNNQWPELHEQAIANPTLMTFPAAWANNSGEHGISGNEPNRFWVKNSRGRFLDIAKALGLDTGVPSRGIATADLDGDGDLDLVIANQWADSFVAINTCSSCGRSLSLNLQIPMTPLSAAIVTSEEGTKSATSRSAIGAEVVVTASGGRRHFAYVDGGNGHSGKRSAEVHIGLGEVSATEPMEIEVRYRTPTGVVTRTTLSVLPGRHTIYLPWSRHD